MIKLHHCDEHLSSWWKFIIVIKYYCVENSWSYWKFIILMKIHLCDENLSLWWKLDIVSKVDDIATLGPSWLSDLIWSISQKISWGPLGGQDYNMYARRTSTGPVPGVPHHEYGTSWQVLDSYAYWPLFIVPEPAHRKRRLLLVIG